MGFEIHQTEKMGLDQVLDKNKPTQTNYSDIKICNIYFKFIYIFLCKKYFYLIFILCSIISEPWN